MSKSEECVGAAHGHLCEEAEQEGRGLSRAWERGRLEHNLGVTYRWEMKHGLGRESKQKRLSLVL